MVVAISGGGDDPEDGINRMSRCFRSKLIGARPRVCYLGHANFEIDANRATFHRDFGNMGCEISNLSLRRLPTGDLRDFIMDRDAFFVGGGNTQSMFALWREWGLDRFLREAYEAGVVVGDVSAGAICWFEQGATGAVPGRLTLVGGLEG